MPQYDIQPGMENLKPGELSEVINQHMIELSVTWARQYEKNAKNFITCFLKYPSIRFCAAFIVQAYKREGAFKECQATGKDFSDYANKQNLDQKWKRVLAETLLIIYSITR